MSDQVMTFDAVLQSAAAATGNGTAMDVGGLSRAGIQVEGITTAEIVIEGTIDGSNWHTVLAVNLADGIAASPISADGIYFVPVGGLSQIRARISAYTAGTITVVAKGVLAGGTIYV